MADFFSPEETADKVKTEGFLLGCVGVMVANEVCDDPLDAVDVDTGKGICVAIGTSILEGDAVQI